MPACRPATSTPSRRESRPAGPARDRLATAWDELVAEHSRPTGRISTSRSSSRRRTRSSGRRFCSSPLNPFLIENDRPALALSSRPPDGLRRRAEMVRRCLTRLDEDGSAASCSCSYASSRRPRHVADAGAGLARQRTSDLARLACRRVAPGRCDVDGRQKVRASSPELRGLAPPAAAAARRSAPAPQRTRASGAEFAAWRPIRAGQARCARSDSRRPRRAAASQLCAETREPARSTIRPRTTCASSSESVRSGDWKATRMATDFFRSGI